MTNEAHSLGEVVRPRGPNDDFESHTLFPKFDIFAIMFTEYIYLHQHRPNIATYFGSARSSNIHATVLRCY